MAKKVTEAQASNAMKEWLDADVELQTTQAEKRREITPIVQKYEDIEKQHLAKKETAQAIIEQYANENRETLLPKGAKSTKFGGATIAWKASPPSLKIAEGKDIADVLEAMEAEGLETYIITKYEIDKAGILRNADTLADQLPTLGLSIESKETFSIKA
jgi:phage host-nuclease inhibitor protein Gam